MAWTSADADTLRDMLKKGVLSVRHGDKMVQFQSRQELMDTLNAIERDLASPARPRFGVVSHSRD